MVDTSALLSVLPEEPDREAAIELEPLLRVKTRVVAPRIQMWEVAHSIHVRHRRRAGGELSDRLELVSRLLRYTTFDEGSSPAIATTGRLAETHGISVYDAAYLELAIRMNAVVVTQDQKLLRIAREILGEARGYDVAGLLRRLTGAS